MDERKRKNRRPTREEQLEIQRRILLHYNRGLSIEEVHCITGYNSKTISKYFNKLSYEIEKTERQNLIERDKNERKSVILCYKYLMTESYQALDDINAEIEKCKLKKKVLPAYFLSKKLETIRLIATLNEKKGEFIVRPTLHEALDMLIQEKVKKKRERDSEKKDDRNSERKDGPDSEK